MRCTAKHKNVTLCAWLRVMLEILATHSPDSCVLRSSGPRCAGQCGTDGCCGVVVTHKLSTTWHACILESATSILHVWCASPMHLRPGAARSQYLCCCCTKRPRPGPVLWQASVFRNETSVPSHMQHATHRAGQAWLAFRCIQAVAAALFVVQTLQALGALPSVSVVISALAAALLPFAEVLLVTVTLMVPMAMLLILHDLADERMTTARLVAGYMMNGAVTGTPRDACPRAPRCLPSASNPPRLARVHRHACVQRAQLPRRLIRPCSVSQGLFCRD